MSFQAVTWAIEQKAGTPSAKATLWSIANYANEQWCAWPSQKTICDESEQSPDSVQRRLPELEARGLIRRIPLQYAGRKTVDFIILAPSPFFHADLAKIEPLLPRGCVIDPRHAAADSGNAEAADSSATLPQTLPQALPQSAVDAAAYVRQQEPVMEPENQIVVESAHARDGRISVEATSLADEAEQIAGIDRAFIPPGWCGAPARIDALLRSGCTGDDVRTGVRMGMATLGSRGPPDSFRYFEKPIQRARQDRSAPVPVLPQRETRDAQTIRPIDTRTGWQRSRDAGRDAKAELDAFIAAAEAGDGEGGPAVIGLLPAARRG